MPITPSVKRQATAPPRTQYSVSPLEKGGVVVAEKLVRHETPAWCRQTAHADEYDNFNICAEFFYMEMYTDTTIVGWRSICSLKVTKMGVDKPRLSSLFGNSRGGSAWRERRNGGNGPGFSAQEGGADTGHEHPPGLARRQGVPPWLA